jgi:4-aminobutyrate---pyruvate transaminase
MHPNVNLRTCEKTGGLVVERADGIQVTGNNGKRYIEAIRCPAVVVA